MINYHEYYIKELYKIFVKYTKKKIGFDKFKIDTFNNVLFNGDLSIHIFHDFENLLIKNKDFVEYYTKYHINEYGEEFNTQEWKDTNIASDLTGDFTEMDINNFNSEYKMILRKKRIKSIIKKCKL